MISKEFKLDENTYKLFTTSEKDPYFQYIDSNHENFVISLLKQAIPADAVAFDVGANIGVMSLIISHHLGGGGYFILF